MVDKDLISRIKVVMRRFGLNQSEFAKRIGMRQPEISNILRGLRGCGDVVIQRIVNSLSISEDWLMTGEGEMLRGGVGMVNVSCGHGNASVRENNGSFTINSGGAGEGSRPRISYSEGRPYYNVDFMAGFDLVMNDQTTKPEYRIDFQPYNGEGVVWCNITGNSMSPKISHGDIIAIREVKDWREYIAYGEIYAIVTKNDMRTVKVIRRGTQEGRIRLVPVNTAEYDEQEIAVAMVSRVFQVIGCMKRI